MTTTLPTPAADTLRNAELQTLAQALNDQRTRSIDVVVPAKKLRAVLGAIELSGVEPVMSEDGVTNVDGFYTPTGVGDEGIAAKLGIPIGYLRRMRGEAIDLYDVNVNGWCERSGDKFLLRLLTHRDGPTEDGSAGVLRAFLSDRYRCIDNFDVLVAALKGLGDAGVTDPHMTADLTERRMIVRVSTPDVAVRAPKLLEGYRSPFAGRDVTRSIQDGGDLVWAGFALTNSETGNGSFSVTPRMVVRVCKNGMTITKDAMSRVHLGGKLDDGVIQWSDATLRKNLDLVTSQTTDAVKTFLNVDYLNTKVAELEKAAGVEVPDAPAVITTVSKRLGFSEAEQATILGHFIKGGQLTCGGVMQAVTSAAQTLPDGDAAWELESKGVAAMEHAVAAVRALART